MKKNPLRSVFLVIVLTGLTAAPLLAADAPPTDNPVAAFYGGVEGYPAWTDRIAWSRVINMQDYPHGNSAFEKFEHARDALAAQGGGVLYYPAGVYDFSDMPADGPGGRGLMLKRGVVIRGGTPTKKLIAAKTGQLELPTTFVFGFRQRDGGQTPRDWNLIGLSPPEGGRLSAVDDVGVCNVHLVGAIVYFGPDVTWGKTWRDAGSWHKDRLKAAWAGRVPDGSHPADPFAGGVPESNGGKYELGARGRLVFNCQLDDAVMCNDYVDWGFGPQGYQQERFCGRVNAYGAQVFVANNCIPRSEKNFIHRQKVSRGDVQPVLFDYACTTGIDVNKTLTGLVRQGGDSPGLFQEGVVVRDNWVFNHGGKGFNISGQWVTIAHNHNERAYLRSSDNAYGLNEAWVLTLNGYSIAGGASDNLSRAFDVAGRNVWVDGNTFNNTGSDPGNDGEGILCQLHGGTHVWSWACTHNRYDRQNGEPSYIGGWDVHCRGFLIAFNDIPSGWVGNAVIRKGTVMEDCAFVTNHCTKVLPVDQTANAKRADVLEGMHLPLVTAPEGSPAPPKGVTSMVNQKQDAVDVAWRDASDNEIGFRVQRRLDPSGGGAWRTIAYRPPHIEGSAGNPQAWRDHTAPRGVKLAYRVVAINAADNDAGASAATPVVELPPLP